MGGLGELGNFFYIFTHYKSSIHEKKFVFVNFLIYKKFQNILTKNIDEIECNFMLHKCDLPGLMIWPKSPKKWGRLSLEDGKVGTCKRYKNKSVTHCVQSAKHNAISYKSYRLVINVVENTFALPRFDLPLLKISAWLRRCSHQQYTWYRLYWYFHKVRFWFYYNNSRWSII